jgi:tetratricopeptide (TPR) repeat protein
LLIEQGRYDEALPPLARATELRGDVAVFYNNLGMALECTGHFRAATEAYDAAVTIDGGYEKAVNNFNRIATVLEEPGLEPVDLSALAQCFVEDIARWDDTLVATGEGEPVEAVTPASADTPAVSADSTAGSEPR